MRQWFTIVCVIALLLYVGWVLDHHDRQASALPGVPNEQRTHGVM